MKNFIIRAITGILFVVVFTGCTWGHPISYGMLFTLITALCINEFGMIVNEKDDVQINTTVCALAGAYLFLAMMSFCAHKVDIRIFLPYIVLILFLVVEELYLKRENPINNWAYTMMSQIYIAAPFVLLNVLAFHKSPFDGTISFNPILPLSIFIFLWMNDTGAYCIGSLIGKHKLFPRISPHKSWEGSIGGAVLALIAAAILGYFFNVLTYAQWLGMALTAVVFGSWGDLVESLLKRTLQIKDSGNILPGHGGMLDRFDSSLLAIPAAVVYLFITTLF